MQTKVKANSIVTSQVTPEGIVFSVKDAGSITLNLSAVSEAIKARACLHGLNQRIIDAAAKSRDPSTGMPAAPQAKLEAMKRLVDHYASGTEDWSPAREASSGPGLDALALFAVAEATEKDLPTTRAFIEAGATKHGITQRAYLAKLCTSALVAPILTRLRAAQAPEVSADDELEGLMG